MPRISVQELANRCAVLFDDDTQLEPEAGSYLDLARAIALLMGLYAQSYKHKDLGHVIATELRYGRVR